MTQKDPSGDVIEELEGEQLLHAIHHSESLAVFFCEYMYIYTYSAYEVSYSCTNITDITHKTPLFCTYLSDIKESKSCIIQYII